VSLPVALVVDTGVDDALALVTAAWHPALSLVAVVATGGNAPLEQTAANTLAVLAAAGVDDVPVGRGSARRLDGEPYPSRSVHGLDGLGGRAPAALDHARLASLPAAERVLSALPEDVLLVCLAPLTCLVGLPRRRVLASFAAAGQANADADPQAARAARAAHDVVAEPPPAPVALPLGRVRGLARALLAQRGSRGPGDAATVLRLAGSHDPVSDLVELLEQRAGGAGGRRGRGT
jgi:hypothetical protein